MSVLQIRTEHILKEYPGTRALDDVSICFDSGRVHALVGKNGSGKSTLVKIFAGAIKPTSGEFYLNDRGDICRISRGEFVLNLRPGDFSFY